MSSKAVLLGSLSSRFFGRSTVEVARALLGVLLVHESPAGRTVGRIVETEAYLGAADPASHAYRGSTPRNRSMFGSPGTAYVYRIYGLHDCLNVVTAPEGVGEAVLLRALEPIEGLELMEVRRGRSELRELCSGPAKLVRAMGVTRAHDGTDLRTGALRLMAPRSSAEEAMRIVSTTRIGIQKAADLPLRFYCAGSPFVSKA